MKITKVIVRKHEKERCKALAEITLDDCFVIHSARLIQTDNGYVLAMPSKKNIDGTYIDMCHPINQETRDLLTNAVLDEYRKIG